MAGNQNIKKMLNYKWTFALQTDKHIPNCHQLFHPFQIADYFNFSRKYKIIMPKSLQCLRVKKKFFIMLIMKSKHAKIIARYKITEVH